MSENPSHNLKFWRKKFGIKQVVLAKKMEIAPSVLSDYEKGRRPSPGSTFIKKYLIALYHLAIESGTFSDLKTILELKQVPESRVGTVWNNNNEGANSELKQPQVNDDIDEDDENNSDVGSHTLSSEDSPAIVQSNDKNIFNSPVSGDAE
jgi:predicted transcriptional regulator